MAKKASENFKLFQNPNGPDITTVARPIIEADGLYFKDIDGTGVVSEVNDWRLPSAQRAAAYVKQLTLEEKIGQLFISDWRMGPKYPSARLKGHVAVADESGCVDEAEVNQKTIFGEQHLPGTSTLIKEWWARHTILRENAQPDDLADYLNQMQAIAEECQRFVPVQAASNSRNENGEIVFGMNDSGGVFPTWPGTLGIAAAVKGSGIEVADKWAEATRQSWEVSNLRKGYMYMVDCMSDPRWQRSYGTFGEDPALICEIAEHIIPRIQGSEECVTKDGVAVTMKHFPGGGPRENGFDPHYAAGQWNVYATPGSLQQYHMPGFKSAVAKNTSSIMPYYSKPAAAKSSVQQDCEGKDIRFDPYGFAYNRYFIHDILRGQMGFKGYINSDTGIVHNMCWGVEALDTAERIGFAINNSGVDVISGLYDNEGAKEAYARATNGYYETHQLPEGITPEMVTLNDEVIDRAVTRTLTEMFELGMFENTYRCAKKAKEVVSSSQYWADAELAHRQSVVLLKNDGALPLNAAGKKVYVEAFKKDPKQGELATAALREMVAQDATLVEDYNEADIAIFFVNPSSGDYFTATAGYLELDICEGKEVPNVDDFCRPMKETHLETTLTGVGKIAEIATAVHAKGGKVISNINFPLAWLVGNVERNVDALLAGFETYPAATLDVIFGRYNPTGKLPITLPKGDEVLAVNEDGVCVSPNDVPGYDKDQYMPAQLKDENGKAYAYRDAAGNYYELNFGLSYNNMAITYYHPQWGAERPIRGILFDMDGLVLDSEALYTRFWREAAHALGYPMTVEQSLGMRSLGKKLGQPYLESLFGPTVDYTTLRNKRIQLMDAYVAQHGIAVKPGIYELLDYMDEHGIAAAITSSSPMAFIERHLSDADLLHRFQKLCSGHAIPNGKPAPDIYLLGAKELGLKPEECLALEDSPTGILSAYRAGCLSVMIPDLDQPEEETQKLLFAKADSLTDIISILKAQNGHL